MKKTLGMIGCGNMGSAIIKGIVSANLFHEEQLMVADSHEASVEKLVGNRKILGTTNNQEVARQADILILAVKPNIYQAVLEEINQDVKDDVILVSIAAGKTLSFMEGFFKKPVKLVRAMTNTPALVGEAMSAVCTNGLVTDQDLADVVAVFNSFGKTQVVDESLMDAITGCVGSSPAYVYMLIEAMADAAVLNGIPRNMAYTMTAQAVLGAAKMVLSTGKHPGELKDMVTSPGGTTIEGIYELERQGFRQAIMSAMNVGTEKSKRLGK